MTAQDLKNSILQLAIQGKLVEQREEEGTAEELYKQIQEEKQKLIKENKIKRSKHLPEITEEEIPFDIPVSWKWVRLDDIVSILGDGLHGTPKYDLNGDYYFINGNNFLDGKIIIKDNTKKVNFEEFIKYKKNLNNNTVFVSINGTIGNIAFFCNEKIILGKSACYFNLITEKLKPYIYWIIKTQFFLKYAIHFATGTTIKNVSLSTMRNFLIPLPPQSEQKRIVEKIEELMPYIEKYDNVYNELTKLNTSFPTDIEKSILQYAIQGKLVEQREEEGTAEGLYKQIQEEKQKLIKEKKIKKSKPIPEITEDEISFDIPDSWKWVRLGDISHNWGQKKPNTIFDYVDVGSVDNITGTLNKNENLINPEKAPSRARKIIKKGTVIYSTVRPYLLNICIIDRDFNHEPIASTAFAILHPFVGIYNKYLYYILKSTMFTSYVNSTMKGVAYPAINEKNLLSGIVPIPPLSEQKRIVEKIEELMKYTKKLN